MPKKKTEAQLAAEAKRKEIAEAKKADKAAAKAAKEAAKSGNTGAKAKVEHRHISELSTLDRNNLEAILRKEPGAIDEVDLATLQARVAYLTTDERKKYGV